MRDEKFSDSGIWVHRRAVLPLQLMLPVSSLGWVIAFERLAQLQSIGRKSNWDCGPMIITIASTTRSRRRWRDLESRHHRGGALSLGPDGSGPRRARSATATPSRSQPGLRFLPPDAGPDQDRGAVPARPVSAA